MKAAILQTLSYHHLFQDPLTIEQIHEFLITPNLIPLASVRRSVKQMLRKHQIIRHEPYYALLSFLQQNVCQHTDRMRASQEKLAIARRAAKVISFVPWVKLVAVTGALAMENADEQDDIDFMIVTEKNRLWLSRLVVTILVTLFFKRRKPIPSSFILHPSSFSNTLCLNLWLDEGALAIPKDQRNLYTAHELVQMKPLVNRDYTYEQMMEHNNWGKKFLANAWERDEQINGQIDEWTNRRVDKLVYWSIFPFIYVSYYLFHFLDIIAFNIQYWYMKSKMTTERVSLSAAYFHPGNRSREILLRYTEILGKLSLS